MIDDKQMLFYFAFKIWYNAKKPRQQKTTPSPHPPQQNKIGNKEEIIKTEYLTSLTLDSDLTQSPELCQMEITVSS